MTDLLPSRLTLPAVIVSFVIHTLINMAQHQPVEQCQCNGCTGLPTVRDGLLGYISALDIEQPEEIAIASQVLDGLDNLHTSIRMRHEAVRVNATNGGVINGQPPVVSGRSQCGAP